MRHRVYGKKLGRNKNERTALFKSLVQGLVLHGSIITTEPKAKAIKGLVDKIINLAKSKNTKRLLSAYFSNKLLQMRLVKEIAPKLENRVSGYTSMIRIGVREGDRTVLVKMSIIGNENLKSLEQVVTKQTVKVEKKIEKPAVKKVAVKKATTKKTTSKRRSK